LRNGNLNRIVIDNHNFVAESKKTGRRLGGPLRRARHVIIYRLRLTVITASAAVRCSWIRSLRENGRDTASQSNVHNDMDS